MSNAKVSLVIRVKLPDGSRRYCPPVITPNGRLKPLYAERNGQPVHHPEGVYALRYREQGRLVYESLGSDPAEVFMAQKKKEAYLQAVAAGLDLAEVKAARTLERPAVVTTRIGLAEAIENYVAEVKHQKSRKTHLAYSLSLKLFTGSCSKQFLEEIERKDIIAYMAHLKSQGCGPRTIANRVSFLKTFFLHQGLKWPLLKSDRPRYTEKVVSAYSKEEIRQLMIIADREEYELFQFFLCTGAREQEVQYATWRDVDLHQKTFAITEKLDLGFVPKDKEEGAVPIPDSLVELLRARRKRHPQTRLLFPGSNGKPNGHFLRILKRLAFRASLNCGHCFNKQGRCCAEHPVCDRWELHRWRKTYATMHHEAGVPVRTIQRWLRHSDLETTLRYLAGSDDKSERTRQQVNATFAGLAGPCAISA